MRALKAIAVLLFILAIAFGIYSQAVAALAAVLWVNRSSVRVNCINKLCRVLAWRAAFKRKLFNTS